MAILLIEKNESLRAGFSAELQANFELEVFEFDGAKKAIETIDNNKEIAVVISDQSLADGTGSDIYNHLKSTKSGVPFILFSKDNYNAIADFKNLINDQKGNGYIMKPLIPGQFIGVVEEALKNSNVSKTSTPKETLPYSPIKINLWSNLTDSPVEVFVKLSSDKFVKIATVGQNIGEIAQRYKEKSATSLFVKNEDKKNVLSAISASLLKNFMSELDGDDSSGSKVNEIMVSSLSLMKEQIENMGISADTMDLVQKINQKTASIVQKNQSLLDLFNNISGNQYQTEHSLMTSFVGQSMVANSQFNNEENCQHISMAAFLHDILLPNDEVSMIQNQNDPALRKQPKEIVAKYLGHPEETAEMVLKQKIASKKTATIILQHHENVYGTGFPKRLWPKDTLPLSAFFIVAHEFCHKFYGKSVKPEERLSVLKMMREQYNKAPYSTAFQALIKSLSDGDKI